MGHDRQHGPVSHDLARDFLHLQYVLPAKPQRADEVLVAILGLGTEPVVEQ